MFTSAAALRRETMSEQEILKGLIRAFEESVPAGPGWREVTVTEEDHARLLAFLRHSLGAARHEGGS
jgi:hypothetical protein